MKKAGLISSVASKLGISQSAASAYLNAVLESITDCLESGDKLVIANFGAFDVKTRAAGVARNLKTGEPISVGETKSVSFKAAKALKAAISGCEEDAED